MKVLFLTDAHLGAGTDTLDRERQLCRLIQREQRGLDKLILLGDIFDFWFTYHRVVPKGHTRLLGKLAELSDLGVEIHYFIGNHDMWLFDYLQQEIGAIMHPDPATLQIDGKRILLGHGDGLGHLDKKYDFLKWMFRCPFNQWLFKLFPSSFSFWIATSWSGSSRKNHPYEEQHYLGDDREGIVIWIKEQIARESVDYCIFGHRHTPVDINIQSHNGNTCRYVNVGDFITHRSYAIMQDGELTLLND